MKKINVLLADDHQIVLDGIRSFLSNEPSIEVVGIAKDGLEALTELHSKKVDVAILDIGMPHLNGLDTAKKILIKYPKTKILLLTMIGESKFIVNAMRLGINGYVIKEKSQETLIAAIHAVYKGNSYWPPELIARISDPKALLEKEELDEVKLTERELEILCLIVSEPSWTARDIARHLNIARVTVETHIRNMKQKLQLNKKTELVNYGIKKKICT